MKTTIFIPYTNARNIALKNGKSNKKKIHSRKVPSRIVVQAKFCLKFSINKVWLYPNATKNNNSIKNVETKNAKGLYREKIFGDGCVGALIAISSRFFNSLEFLL